MNKWVIIGILVFLLVGLLVIFSIRSSSINIESTTLDCITKNSVVYVLSSCYVCAEQKKLFGQHISDFKVVECSVEKELCELKGIQKVPTWEINGEKYEGLKTIEELIYLNNCS